MKRLLALCLFVFLIALPVQSATGPKNPYVSLGTKIASLGLDAARSFEIENLRQSGIWGLMVVYIHLTDADDSTTALNMICTGSEDNNTTPYALHDCTIAAGLATCVNVSWTTDPSGVTSPKAWIWRIDIEGIEDIECTFSDTGGLAADKLKVDVTLAKKG